MTILIYYPYNHRSVEQQSVMELLVKQGHKLILFTTCESGPIHEIAEQFGVTALHSPGNSKNKLGYYWNNAVRLIHVIRKYKVDVLLAHQQKPALVAGLVRMFIPFRLFYVRHNSDEDYLLFPHKAKWLNWLVNRVTKVKIAPSDIVRNFWIQHEHVNPRLIRRINYGYNFSQYDKPDPKTVGQIRQQYGAGLFILSVARLIEVKRHPEMFAIVKNLRDRGIDCKLVCIGAGPLKQKLQKEIVSMGLEDSIFLEGIKTNVPDYIAAADIILHLSVTEASNSVVKEAGLCKKPVIVCHETGDFEEYIRHGENGFLVDKCNPVPQVCALLTDAVQQKLSLLTIGDRLYETITTYFDINNVSGKYSDLLHVEMKSFPKGAIQPSTT